LNLSAVTLNIWSFPPTIDFLYQKIVQSWFASIPSLGGVKRDKKREAAGDGGVGGLEWERMRGCNFTVKRDMSSRMQGECSSRVQSYVLSVRVCSKHSLSICGMGWLRLVRSMKL
jgi:hypothetical protein